MTKRTPTNADIYQVLGRLEEKIEQVHEQTIKTNGRVNRLESWKQALDAVEKYKKWNPLTPPEQKAEGWTTREKTLTGIISALIALAVAIAAGLKP